MSKYGWFLRHRVTGSFARIVDPRDGVASWEDRLSDATHFDHRKFAQDVADYIAPGAYDVMDGTIWNDPTPDANPEDKIARPREEVQAELKKQAAEYYAQHAHKVPLRRRERIIVEGNPTRTGGYGMRRFGGGPSRDADREVDDPSLGKAPELNASAPSDQRATSVPAPTSAEEAEAMRPFRPAFGRPTWP